MKLQNKLLFVLMILLISNLVFSSSITYVNKIPNDINSTNFFTVFFNYTIGDNLTNPKLYYKINDSSGTVFNYINGTPENIDWNIRNMTCDKINNICNVSLYDNQIYPHSGNVDPDVYRNNPAIVINETNIKVAYLSKQFNFKNDTIENFVEISVNGTTSSIIEVYLANSSWDGGTYIYDSEVCSIGGQSANSPYHHCHTGTSTICDRAYPFSIVNGKICGTVTVTENMTVIVRTASSGITSYRFLNGLIRTGETQRTSNNGNTWTDDNTKSLIVHIHQLKINTTLNYFGENNGTNTSINYDVYDTNQQLQGSSFYSPINTIYKKSDGLMLINYSNSYNPVGSAIEYYNISLYDTNQVFLQHIINNGINLNYNWNYSSVTNGQYIVGITTKDVTGLTTTSYSDVFNITSDLIENLVLNSTSKYNFTIDNITCHYTLAENITTSGVNWYKNGNSISILNMPMEGNSTIALKDISETNSNYLCGGVCPLWNATGGRDGEGAYFYNATVGMSLYQNMTSSQKNLTSYTVSIWIKPNGENFTSINDFSRIFIAGENGVSYYQIATQRTTNMVYCRNQYNAISGINAEVHQNWNANQWYNVVCVYDNSTLKIYIDGVLRNTTITSGAVATSSNSRIVLGNIISLGGSRVLNGSIDDVFIYSYNLSSEQIYQNYINSNTIVSQELKNDDIWSCDVTPFSYNFIGNKYISNSLSITEYYKTKVSLVYPNDMYQYMNFDGSIILNVNSTTDTNCVINDTRFEKISNNLFYNATINQTEQIIYLSVNCSDEYDYTDLTFRFGIDTTLPFINILNPLNDITYTSNKNNYNFSFYVFDTFLDLMNVTAYNDSVYFYVDENFMSVNNITKNYYINLSEGYNNLEVCIRDSLQNSPKIKDKMINFDVTSNAVIDAIADSNKNVKNNYEFDKENTHLLFMDGVQILRSISQYDKNNKLKTNSLTDFTNIFDDAGEHIKTTWALKKDKIEDYTIIRYECLNGCNKLEVLTDRGRTRIVDDKRTIYFTFDDIEQMGFGVQLYTQNKVAYVKVYYKDVAQFNKIKSKEVIDPITGGLNRECLNRTIIVDSILPVIVFNQDTFANNYYTDGFDVRVDLTVTDNNFNSTTIYLYDETHNLIDTYTGFSQNIIITFTNLTYGVYYFNATTIDLAGNINSSQTRKVTLLGDMNTFALDKYCVDNSLTNNVINAPYCDTNTNCYFDVYYSNVSDYNDLSVIYTFDTTEYYLRNGMTSNSIGVNTPIEENVTLKLKTIWFNATTMKCSPYYINRMKIMTPYYVDVYLYRTDWNNKTKSYSGSFNYVYMLYTNKLDGLLIPTSSQTLSSVNTINTMLKKFNKRQLGIDMQSKIPIDDKVYFWGKYQFGKSTIKLYEKGGHEIYLINSNVYMNYSYPQFSKPINYNTLNYDSLLIKGINLNESTDLGIIVGVEDTNSLELWSKIIKTIFIILLFLIIHGVVFFITARVGIPQISMFLAFITVPITLALIIITWVF